MGCLRKVFRAEIDVDMFELAEAAGGFGGIKMTGDPLPSNTLKPRPRKGTTTRPLLPWWRPPASA